MALYLLVYIPTIILIIKALKIANSLTLKQAIFLTGFLIRIYSSVKKRIGLEVPELLSFFGFRQTLLDECYLYEEFKI